MEDLEPLTSVEGILRASRLEAGFGPSYGIWDRLWYRGHADIGWTLRPKAQRGEFVQRAALKASKVLPRMADDEEVAALIHGRELFQEFFRLGPTLGPFPSGIVEAYFLAQHYGLPTNLLDWTLNPAVALFFACQSQPESDGALFALAANKGTTHFTGSATTAVQTPLAGYAKHTALAVGALVDDLLNKEAGHFGGHYGGAIPVLPVPFDGRMKAQFACFTLHTKSDESLESVGSLLRLRIPAESKPIIARELRALGITQAAVFPDLTNLVKELTSQFFTA